jgi:predicted DNA-binding protein
MRGTPMTTTLPPADHAYIEGLAKALGRSVSSVLAEIIHKHITAEVERLSNEAPRKRK